MHICYVRSKDSDVNKLHCKWCMKCDYDSSHRLLTSDIYINIYIYKYMYERESMREEKLLANFSFQWHYIDLCLPLGGQPFA